VTSVLQTSAGRMIFGRIDHPAAVSRGPSATSNSPPHEPHGRANN